MTFNEIKTDILDGEKTYGAGNAPAVNLPSKVWTPYLNSYQPQKYLFFDSDECSQLGGFISGMEKFFNMKRALGLIPPTFLAFLEQYWNGSSYAFSVRYVAIQDGTSINGNVMQSGYKAFPSIGLIPQSMLDWSDAEAALYTTQAEMDAAYYSRSAITPAMEALGQQFLSFIADFEWGWWWNNPNQSCPLSVLEQALLTSPVSVAVPVTDATWNQIDVPYNSGTTTDHCVDVYCIDMVNPNYPTMFTDQYQPWLKQFAANYFIPVAIGFNIVFKPEVQNVNNVGISTQTKSPMWFWSIVNAIKWW